MNKKQQKQQKQQEHVKSLREFIEAKTPHIHEKLEIHANRIKSTDMTQEFSLWMITNNYNITSLDYETHQILGTRLTKDQRRLTRKGCGTDLAHDTVRDLERALGYEPYTIRYVEHQI